MNDFSKRIAKLSPERLSLLATELHSRLTRLEARQHEPIAVIGMGCRFPGSVSSPDDYWRNLVQETHSVREIDPLRWDAERYFSEKIETPGRATTRWAGLIDDVEMFDAHFFGIAAREAESMDPQQRLLLEVCWEALERAGQAPDRLRGSRTGVFVGISGSDYYDRLLKLGESAIDAYFASGNAHSVAAGRISYFLGAKGPSFSVDTACSSSLVAIHLAVQSLRRQECRMALAGGVNLILTPNATIALSKADMMAADGRCKAFDASADGFVRGEGCGILVLKRMPDALADGDPIIAAIAGTAINQDGRSNGLTAPNGPSQEDVIKLALADARMAAGDIDYIEAHGTGTSLGDPIEMRALGAVYGRERTKQDPLIVGAVKTNVGHLESAAGVAGLMKLILAIQKGEIPPTLHFKDPNPHIAWDSLPVSIADQLQKWPGRGQARAGGVSSFGFSGTNAHLIVTQAPAVEPAPDNVPERSHHILTASAKTGAALDLLAESFTERLGSIRADELGDLCYTANTGRAHLSHRLAIVGSSADEMAASLTSFVERTPDRTTASGRYHTQEMPQVAFLFTGQGAQYVGMGRGLYETHDGFRHTLERCDGILKTLGHDALLSLLFPEPEDEPAARARLDQTATTQPVLFALEYALADLIRSWGVTPVAMMGHSVGEYVAACMAGVFSLEDGLRLISKRAALMNGLPAGGGMAALFTDEQQVAEAIAPYPQTLSIAAVNGPGNIVISGAESDLSVVLDHFKAQGIASRRLNVSHAFHSPLMDPILNEFEAYAQSVDFRAAQTGLISNVTGEPVGEEEVLNSAYWKSHIRQPVQFARSVQALYKHGCRVFLEIGPKPILTGMGMHCLPDADVTWLPLLKEGGRDWQHLLTSTAALYVKGVGIDWNKLDSDRRRRIIDLPTYPFQRKRFWVETPAAFELRTGEPAKEKWHDWLYDFHWEARPASEDERQLHYNTQKKEEHANVDGTPSDGQNPYWLIFADGGELGQRVDEALKESGRSCIRVEKGEEYKRLDETTISIDPLASEHYGQMLRDLDGLNLPMCESVVYLWGVDETIADDMQVEDLLHIQKKICGGLLSLIQALAGYVRQRAPSLSIITKNAQKVLPADRLQGIGQAGLWGLGRVIALEHPEFNCLRIDIDDASSAWSASAVVNEILDRQADEKQLAFRREERYVLRMQRRPFEAEFKAPSTPLFRSDCGYLVTGGLSGLGLRTAEWMAASGARHLFLMGRSGATSEAQTTIRKMEDAGTNIRIVAGDVGKVDDLRSVLDQMVADQPRIGGIMHCAGVIDDGVLLQQDWLRFANVMHAKVTGSWNLHQLTRNMDIDFLILFSSGAGILGSAGQGNYAAANAFLDALAYYRRANDLPAMTIDWGAWDEVGAATRNNVMKRIKMIGMEGIGPDDGFDALSYLIQTNAVQIGVFPFRWDELFQYVGKSNEKKLFEGLEKEAIDVKDSEIQDSASLFMEEIGQYPPSRQREYLLHAVKGEVAKILGISVDEVIDTHQPLVEGGLDSLMAVELRNTLSAMVNRSLPATLLFNYPSMGEIVQYLEKEVLSLEDHVSGDRADEAQLKEQKISSDELESYTEDEMATLLAEKLQSL